MTELPSEPVEQVPVEGGDTADENTPVGVRRYIIFGVVVVLEGVDGGTERVEALPVIA